jgi:hypothetical protein
MQPPCWLLALLALLGAAPRGAPGLVVNGTCAGLAFDVVAASTPALQSFSNTTAGQGNDVEEACVSTFASPGGNEPDLVFSFVANQTAIYKVQASAAWQFILQTVVCSTNATQCGGYPFSPTTLLVPLQASDHLAIILDGGRYKSNSGYVGSGAFNLTIEAYPGTCNGTAVDRIRALSSFPALVSASTLPSKGGVDKRSGCGQAASAPDFSLAFTVPSSGAYRFTLHFQKQYFSNGVPYDGFKHYMEVVDCATGASLRCASKTFNYGLDNYAIASLEAGKTYTLNVDGYASTTGYEFNTADFNVTIVQYGGGACGLYAVDLLASVLPVFISLCCTTRPLLGAARAARGCPISCTPSPPPPRQCIFASSCTRRKPPACRFQSWTAPTRRGTLAHARETSSSPCRPASVSWPLWRTAKRPTTAC